MSAYTFIIKCNSIALYLYEETCNLYVFATFVDILQHHPIYLWSRAASIPVATDRYWSRSDDHGSLEVEVCVDHLVFCMGCWMTVL